MTGDHARNNRRVLVIDDLESIHEDFRRVLCPKREDPALDEAERALFGGPASGAASAGVFEPFELECAAQGRAGVEAARRARSEERPFAIAFVDMRMPPGWDGLETIENLWRADPEVQTVICTAYSDRSWEEIIGRLGMSDRLLVVKKPFDRVEIAQLSMALASKWAQARAADMKLGELERIAEERAACLRHAATHDALTGLANREQSRAFLQAAIAARAGGGGQFAVLLLDFDRFKVINDSLGHEVGNALLVRIAQRLRTGVEAWRVRQGPQATAIAGRLGGDEFIVCAAGLADTTGVLSLSQEMLESLREPYAINGLELYSTASIGVTTSAHSYNEPSEAMRDADLAMYRAKAAGRDRSVTFDLDMHDGLVERVRTETALRQGVRDGAFEVHYQPIVGLDSGECTGVEGLVRWRRPDVGLVCPDAFITLAEETGMIAQIGRLVLERAARDAVSMAGGPAANWCFGVNVSRRQFLEPNFVDTVEDVLRATGLEPGRLNLEITESMVIERPDVAVLILKRLKALGVMLSMDDFGTGHSSLTCLQTFPVDILKIDRAFVKLMTNHRKHSAVVHAIIVLAGNLGIKVVAEGIETIEQLAQMQAMDCAAGQGYFFSRPRPLDAVVAEWSEFRPFPWAIKKPLAKAA